MRAGCVNFGQIANEERELMANASRSEETRTRFSEINLHDSDLTGVHLASRAGSPTDELYLDLGLLVDDSDYERIPARLTFHNCFYVKMEIDVNFKKRASNAISYSECVGDSAFRREVEAGMQETALAVFWEFVVSLCPPSGEIRVFAQDFSLEELRKHV